MDIMEDNIIDTKAELCMIARAEVSKIFDEVMTRDNKSYNNAKKSKDVKKIVKIIILILDNNIFKVNDSLDEINSGNFEKRKSYFKCKGESLPKKEQDSRNKKIGRLYKKYITNNNNIPSSYKLLFEILTNPRKDND